MGEITKKLNKLSLSATILIASVILGGFYYATQVSKQKSIERQKEAQADQEQKFLFSMKKECKQAGEKLYQKNVEDLGRINIFVPEYAYNKELNTCLYFGGHTRTDSISKWVKDSFTNEEIISFMRIGDQVLTGNICPSCLSNEIFNERKRELFGE